MPNVPTRLSMWRWRRRPAIDEALRRFHDVQIGPYWSPERSLVERGYDGIELPFVEERVPHFPMHAT
jgi:hypothetical protein